MNKNELKTQRAGNLSRWLLTGALGLSFGAFATQVAPVTASGSAAAVDGAATQATCSAARAVHDADCANYTGFKTFDGGHTDSLTKWAQSEQEHLAKVEKERAEAKAEAQAAEKKRSEKYAIGKTLDRGDASWYGPGFHGRLTANGERYDMHAMTAAHKTLPFGTRVMVESKSTGKKVVVRINDRGPFIAGRVIDLSKSAAKELGILHRGHDQVVLRVAKN